MSPRTALIGQEVTITAIFTGGDGVVDCGVGPVQSGVPAVLAALDQSATFTLTVKNRDGLAVTSTSTVAVSPDTTYHPAFTLNHAGTTPTGLSNHTGTLLANGRVLVAGGHLDFFGNPLTNTSTGFVYNPDTQALTSTGALVMARGSHTATRLSDGRVLMVGGYPTSQNSIDAMDSSEIYDPTSNQFTLCNKKLNVARALHTCTLLRDGRVLITGGAPSKSGNPTEFAEVFDSVKGTFTLVGAMKDSRRYHTATLLTDGRVLITGGEDLSSMDPVASAEIYDPNTNTFTYVGSMTVGRILHTATLLPNGKVLICGGYFRNWLSSCEVFDPATGTFTATGSLSRGNVGHTATLLPDGKVVVLGGLGSGPGEIYDPANGSFSDFGNTYFRSGHVSLLVNGNRVVIIGGEGGPDPILSIDQFQ